MFVSYDRSKWIKGLRLMKKERFIWMIGGAVITVVIFIIAQQFVFGTSSAEHLTEAEAEQLVLSTYNGEVEQITDEGETYQLTIRLDRGSYLIVVDKALGDIIDIDLIEANDQIVEKEPSIEQNEDDEREDSNEQEIVEDDTEAAEDNETTVIDEQGAREIALENREGEVVEAEFIQEENDSYYNIEVQADDTSTFLQIDALTGDIFYEEQKRVTLLTQNEAAQIALDQVFGEIDDIEIKEINGEIYFLVEIETDDDDLEAVVQVHSVTGETTIYWEED